MVNEHLRPLWQLDGLSQLRQHQPGLALQVCTCVPRASLRRAPQRQLARWEVTDDFKAFVASPPHAMGNVGKSGPGEWASQTKDHRVQRMPGSWWRHLASHKGLFRNLVEIAYHGEKITVDSQRFFCTKTSLSSVVSMPFLKYLGIGYIQ